MQIEERVRELVEEKIADRADLFIVRIRMHNNGILEIMVDGDDDIAMEDSVQISRHVGIHLEEDNAIDRAYLLDVSSPAIDTPLLLHRQYQKNIGRTIRVKGLEGDKREGKLSAVNDKSITIEEIIKEKGKKAVQQEAEIPLDNITETKVLISFK